MIRMNIIKNNEVTTADVNSATKAYGPDVGEIKGKTTRSKPVPVTSDIMEIPDKLLEVQQGKLANKITMPLSITKQADDSSKQCDVRHCLDCRSGS